MDGNQPVLAGVVSYGSNPCAAKNSAGVYQDPAFFYDWILEKINENTVDPPPPGTEKPDETENPGTGEWTSTSGSSCPYARTWSPGHSYDSMLRW